jgi:peptide-O-fucosyltransferase
LAVHLRRRDFLRSRSDHTPSIKHAAKQIKKQMERLGLKKVFLATDTHQSEIDELVVFLKNYTIVRFAPTQAELKRYYDGGVAIIDQWICAHAKFFIGSYESTYSFRIQEEREILGFDPKTTFNLLCSNKNECARPSVWTIAY